MMAELLPQVQLNVSEILQRSENIQKGSLAPAVRLPFCIKAEKGSHLIISYVSHPQVFSKRC
jgi:hypothetical protein